MEKLVASKKKKLLPEKSEKGETKKSRPKEVTVRRADNGFIVSFGWEDPAQKVASSIEDAVDILKEHLG